MIVTGNLQLDIDVSKRTEIDEAIKLLESLILSPPSDHDLESDLESSLESAVSNEEEESLALDKAAEELDKKYSHDIPDHDRKSGSSHVMEKLPPKVLESKLKQFKDIFDKYVDDEISSYRILKPILKSGLANNNAEGRELIRIALKRNLIKETRSEVYAHIE